MTTIMTFKVAYTKKTIERELRIKEVLRPEA